MNRHQFEQAAKHFRAGRLTLSDFADQVFPPEATSDAQADKSSNTTLGLPERKADAHKGDFGRVLVIGGSKEMPGSISLTGMAALRSGSGLAVVATPSSIAHVVAGFSPCYVTVGIQSWEKPELMQQYLEWADVIAIGPGLGTSVEAQKFVADLYRSAKQPMVIDADGLNCLAEQGDDWVASGGQRILTPHPGEFRRVLGESITRREQAEEAAFQLAIKENVVVVLKGSQTFVTDGKRSFKNQTGNPGMATGGSGDVLTGVIASLTGQGLSGYDAACLGVRIHGTAGDLAAKSLGQTSLISSDLLDYLPKAFQS